MNAIQCQVLVGREGELDALTDGLDRLADESGGLVFLTGEPGVGKSRLATETATIAAERGLLVLGGRAVQASAPVPLRPIAEALMGVARTSGIPDAPEIEEFRPALASMVPAWNGPDERADMSPLILGEAVVRLLTVLGRTGALLVLEELQWADPETLAIVEYLADNLADRRVLCVATVRDSEPSPALDLVRTLHSRRTATIVDVRRLTEPEVKRMAAACLDQQTAPRAVVQRLLRDCDGLPFAIEEILAAAVSSGELMTGAAGWQVNADVRTGVPTSIAGSVRQRLATPGPEVTDVIVSAAVLGRHFDWTLLPAVNDMTESDVLAALRRARDVQLIEPHSPSQEVFRFRHSLTRESIVADLLPPDRANRAARAVAAIEDAHPDLPGAWCELAAELHETAGQAVQAATLLLEAGRRDLGHGTLISAEAALRKARTVLAQTPSAEPDLLVAVDYTLSNVLMFAGDCDQLIPVADRLLIELDATGAPLERKAVVRLKVARSLSECNRVTMAEQQLAAGRSLANNTPNPGLGGWLDVVAARCAIDRGEPDRALDLAKRALAAAEEGGFADCTAEAACEALEVIGRAERIRDIGVARAAFERAYQIGSDHGLPVRRIRAAPTPPPPAPPRRCQRAAGRLKMWRVEAMAMSTQACLLAVRGERRHVEFFAEQAEHIAPADPEILTTTWGEARVTASIFADDLPGALDASTAGISYARKESLTAPSMAWGYWPLLRAVCGEDGRDALDEARAAGAEVSFWNRGCLSYAEAVLEGREGHRERAAELAEEAGALLIRCAPRWNHVLRWLIAPAALGDGWGEPVPWLAEAIGDFEASGHDRLATACRGVLRRAGRAVPRSGRGKADVPPQLRRQGVTKREMDVFLLVGQGCSNADIADRLFISPKTVETHVASLVNKTSQSGRRELVALAAQSGRAARS